MTPAKYVHTLTPNPAAGRLTTSSPGYDVATGLCRVGGKADAYLKLGMRGIAVAPMIYAFSFAVLGRPLTVWQRRRVHPSQISRLPNQDILNPLNTHRGNTNS